MLIGALIGFNTYDRLGDAERRRFLLRMLMLTICILILHDCGHIVVAQIFILGNEALLDWVGGCEYIVDWLTIRNVLYIGPFNRLNFWNIYSCRDWTVHGSVLLKTMLGLQRRLLGIISLPVIHV